ncbi:MAG TPA: helix-hairpin-helix domain-containing protein, partial [Acidimicrobiales bacterium]|nr:helix-hairpin-helix domain-containing protein [Acidimicrobiales bacterium]
MTRSNDEVAARLSEMAELLSIGGGDPYRVRAYEKAARAVESYPLEVDELDARALDEIPAVGSHIAAKILQLASTGHLDELDELRAQVPAGLRSLLGVPGLGPKRARQIYDELHVTSLPELAEAVRAEQLRHLKGWGDKSEAHLGEVLRQYREAAGRMQLATALALAEELLGELASVPGVERATYAGSLRRRCETIGDIDLLVAAVDPVPVMDAFAACRLVAEVGARGSTKSVATTTTGVQVDLRVIRPEVFGAALVYFTGSK